MPIRADLLAAQTVVGHVRAHVIDGMMRPRKLLGATA